MQTHTLNVPRISTTLQPHRDHNACTWRSESRSTVFICPGASVRRGGGGGQGVGGRCRAYLNLSPATDEGAVNHAYRERAACIVNGLPFLEEWSGLQNKCEIMHGYKMLINFRFLSATASS